MPYLADVFWQSEMAEVDIEYFILPEGHSTYCFYVHGVSKRGKELMDTATKDIKYPGWCSYNLNGLVWLLVQQVPMGFTIQQIPVPDTIKTCK